MNSIQFFTVIHDEHFDRIPTSCEFDDKDRTCLSFFLKLLESYGPRMSATDKEAIRNKMCESSWNQFGKGPSRGRFSYIRCATGDSERVKHNCQRICNIEKRGSNILFDKDT